jgi:hypothetical protein
MTLVPQAFQHQVLAADRFIVRCPLPPAWEHRPARILSKDAAFAPRGCFAQAWTVAEVLRAWR